MLPDYLHEIDYKFKNYQDTKYEFLFDFDFNYADIFNCLVCLFLNIMFIYCFVRSEIQVNEARRFMGVIKPQFFMKLYRR